MLYLSTFKSQLASDGPGVRVLCPTRWAVQADSFHSIISNWPVLTQLWEESLEIMKDSETVARIWGVASQMHCFTFPPWG